MENSDYRKEFLLKLYDQMFNDINRHILVNWQSTGVLIGSFALFALSEKKIISIDISAALIILICGWLIAHLFDASYWYNRNLAIIANVEKQFLKSEDLRLVHYYFGKHRPKNKMIFHLKIQFALGAGIAMIVLLYHFISQVYPNIRFSLCDLDLLKSLPYLIGLIVMIFLRIVSKNRDKSYGEFLANSPGLDIETTNINYGVGHGFDINEK